METITMALTYQEFASTQRCTMIKGKVQKNAIWKWEKFSEKGESSMKNGIMDNNLLLEPNRKTTKIILQENFSMHFPLAHGE